MPVNGKSRRRTADGEVVQIRLRDRQLLIALRQDRPDEKNRPGHSLTQRQAAAHVGISHGHYGDIEAGRRHPSLAVGQRLASFYDVELEALCEVVPVPSPVEVADQGAGPDQDEAAVAGDGYLPQGR